MLTASARNMDTRADSEHDQETYNPWSIVNLVFRHLADEDLHPILGESGDPGKPAADLLRALGITPAPEGNRHVTARVNDDLARLREAFEETQPPFSTTPNAPSGRPLPAQMRDRSAPARLRAVSG